MEKFTQYENSYVYSIWNSDVIFHYQYVQSRDQKTIENFEVILW